MVASTRLPNITKKRETRAPRSSCKSRPGWLERASRRVERLNVKASGRLTNAYSLAELVHFVSHHSSCCCGKGPTETSIRVGDSPVRFASNLGKFHPDIRQMKELN